MIFVLNHFATITDGSTLKFTDKFTPYSIVIFIIALFLVLIAFFITPKDWSRTKKGYVFLMLGFILNFLSTLLTKWILINKAAILSQNIIWIQMGIRAISVPILIIAVILLSRQK
ncbi:MAG: hypothetical protein ABIC04_04915 [Nanoarchaeota archaeon]